MPGGSVPVWVASGVGGPLLWLAWGEDRLAAGFRANVGKLACSDVAHRTTSGGVRRDCETLAQECRPSAFSVAERDTGHHNKLQQLQEHFDVDPADLEEKLRQALDNEGSGS